ncbi:Rhodanese-like protein [Biscogniauxia mediterranea]|nr:Rhodanese-like protein [Biscogniauxia mediterranea]
MHFLPSILPFSPLSLSPIKKNSRLLPPLTQNPSNSSSFTTTPSPFKDIKSCLHFPTRSLDATMPTLLRKLADKHTVVFHCALSQQRGPAAALRYLRHREEAAAASSSSGGSGGSGSEKGKEKEKKEEGEGGKKEEKQKQKVYVLDRGFVGWQEQYGLDERLTEGYRKELWEEGY